MVEVVVEVWEHAGKKGAHWWRRPCWCANPLFGWEGGAGIGWPQMGAKIEGRKKGDGGRKGNLFFCKGMVSNGMAEEPDMGAEFRPQAA